MRRTEYSLVSLALELLVQKYKNKKKKSNDGQVGTVV